jgi:hypothetical protein
LRHKLGHFFTYAFFPETFFYTLTISGRSVLADLPLAIDCPNGDLNPNDHLDLPRDE